MQMPGSKQEAWVSTFDTPAGTPQPLGFPFLLCLGKPWLWPVGDRLISRGTVLSVRVTWDMALAHAPVSGGKDHGEP